MYCAVHSEMKNRDKDKGINTLPKAHGEIMDILHSLSESSVSTAQLHSVNAVIQRLLQHKLPLESIRRIWETYCELALFSSTNTACTKTSLSLVRALVSAQTQSLGHLRVSLFRLVAREHDQTHPEIRSLRLQALAELTNEGRDCKPFAQQMGRLLCGWLLVVHPEKQLLKLVTHFARYQLRFLDSSVQTLLINRVCDGVLQEPSAEWLPVLEVFVRCGAGLQEVVRALCGSVNVLSRESWTVTRLLLEGEYGPEGLAALLRLLEGEQEDDRVLRGAVFFLGMSCWGSQRVTCLQVPFSALLPSLQRVLGGCSSDSSLGNLDKESVHSNVDLNFSEGKGNISANLGRSLLGNANTSGNSYSNSNVTDTTTTTRRKTSNSKAKGNPLVVYEVTLAVRRLVTKYGETLTTEWSTLLELVSMCKQHASAADQVRESLGDTCKCLAQLVEKRQFLGDEEQLMEVLFECYTLIGEETKLVLLELLTPWLHPVRVCPRHWKLLSVLYLDQKQSSIKIQVQSLQTLFQVLKRFHSVFSSSLLEQAIAPILPHLSHLLSPNNTQLHNRTQEILLFILSSPSFSPSSHTDLLLTLLPHIHLISLPTHLLSHPSLLPHLLSLPTHRALPLLARIPPSQTLTTHLALLLPHSHTSLTHKILQLLLRDTHLLDTHSALALSGYLCSALPFPDASHTLLGHTLLVQLVPLVPSQTVAHSLLSGIHSPSTSLLCARGLLSLGQGIDDDDNLMQLPVSVKRVLGLGGVGARGLQRLLAMYGTEVVYGELEAWRFWSTLDAGERLAIAQELIADDSDVLHSVLVGYLTMPSQAFAEECTSTSGRAVYAWESQGTLYAVYESEGQGYTVVGRRGCGRYTIPLAGEVGGALVNCSSSTISRSKNVLQHHLSEHSLPAISPASASPMLFPLLSYDEDDDEHYDEYKPEQEQEQYQDVYPFNNFHPPKHKLTPLQLMLLLHPDAHHCTIISPSHQLDKHIHTLDQTSTKERLKVGVLYLAHTQTSARQALLNRSGSAQYLRFLRVLGEMDALQASARYTGGLDRYHDEDGRFFMYHTLPTRELCFHVATLMPTVTDLPHTENKTRLIGNDFCSIVFAETTHESLEHFAVPSRLDILYIFVIPLSEHLFRIQLSLSLNSATTTSGSTKQHTLLDRLPVFSGQLLGIDSLGRVLRQTAAEACKALDPRFQSAPDYWRDRHAQIQRITQRFVGVYQEGRQDHV